MTLDQLCSLSSWLLFAFSTVTENDSFSIDSFFFLLCSKSHPKRLTTENIRKVNNDNPCTKVVCDSKQNATNFKTPFCKKGLVKKTTLNPLPRHRGREAYLRVSARPALLVLLLAGPLVQLGPESLGLPVVELGLELVVEDPGVGGLELQVVTQLLEGLQRALARAGLDKVVEQRVRADHLDAARRRPSAHVPHGPDSQTHAGRR